MHSAAHKALRWLQAHQAPDGSWPAAAECPAPYRGEISSLAVLAFLAHGEIPGSEEFGKTVETGLKWLVKRAEEKNKTAATADGAVEDTLLGYTLAEAYGMTRIPFLMPAAERLLATRVAVAQDAALAKGWPTDPVERRRALALTVWRARAIRAADLVFEKPYPGVAESAAHTARQVRELFTKGADDLAPFETLACAEILFLLGETDVPRLHERVEEVAGAARIDWEKPPPSDVGCVVAAQFWYGAGEATSLCGKDAWRLWSPDSLTEVVRQQRKDGSWDLPASGGGRAAWSPYYTTELCMLVLRWRGGMPPYRIQPPVRRAARRTLDDLDDP